MSEEVRDAIVIVLGAVFAVGFAGGFSAGLRYWMAKPRREPAIFFDDAPSRPVEGDIVIKNAGSTEEATYMWTSGGWHKLELPRE